MGCDQNETPRKMENKLLSLIHDNAPAHQSVFVKDFLAKNNVTTLEHSQNSPDLVPADFYLFPALKSALKGRSFYDAIDIIKNPMEELKKDFKKWFTEMFSAPL